MANHKLVANAVVNISHAQGKRSWRQIGHVTETQGGQYAGAQILWLDAHVNIAALPITPGGQVAVRLMPPGAKQDNDDAVQF